mgnify:CR=1 FL=1
MSTENIIFTGVALYMLVMLGVLAEVIIRTYHESQGKSTYRVAEELAADRGATSEATSGGGKGRSDGQTP